MDEEKLMKPDFNKGDGLIVAVAQDWQTNHVLMVGFMDEAAFWATMQTGFVHYYSRSRARLWRKGEESGHLQIVKSILVDCDQDALVIQVQQIGCACHDGFRACFYRRLDSHGDITLIEERVFDPAEVYGQETQT